MATLMLMIIRLRKYTLITKVLVYANGVGQEVNILGDGEGGKVVVDVVNGKITNAVVSAGGKGYTYGMVDLGSLNASSS